MLQWTQKRKVYKEIVENYNWRSWVLILTIKQHIPHQLFIWVVFLF